MIGYDVILHFRFQTHHQVNTSSLTINEMVVFDLKKVGLEIIIEEKQVTIVMLYTVQYSVRVYHSSYLMFVILTHSQLSTQSSQLSVSIFKRFSKLDYWKEWLRYRSATNDQLFMKLYRKRQKIDFVCDLQIYACYNVESVMQTKKSDRQ